MSIDPNNLPFFVVLLLVLVLEFLLAFTKLLVLRNEWSSARLTIGKTSTSTSTSRSEERGILERELP